MDKQIIRLIAFYLPQFHPIPENDKWWGKGFTEWTNVKKAKPLFLSHYQPHIPKDLGYYDLRDPYIRELQTQLARDHGIYGFCYYHYWFHGKRILNLPIDEVLNSGKPNFPFCFAWVNENWTRVWDGGFKDILIQQCYSAEDDLAHIEWLCEAFRDPRYIRIDNKPLLLIYRATLLPEPLETIKLWRAVARDKGIGEIYLCRIQSCFPDEQVNPYKTGFNAAVGFQPNLESLGLAWIQKQIYMIQKKIPYLTLKPIRKRILDYMEMVEKSLKHPIVSYKYFPCVAPSWDNTSRRKRGQIIFKNSTPEYYQYWLSKTLEQFQPFSPQENFVFINAWNEWGEGNHLEPCQKWGYQYLKATLKVINQFNSNPKG